MENKHYYNGYFFVNEHSVKFTNHWNLNEFKYIYIIVHIILLYLTCPIHIYFPIWWISLGPIFTYQQSTMWLNSAKGQPYPKAQTTLHSRFVL